LNLSEILTQFYKKSQKRLFHNFFKNETLESMLYVISQNFAESFAKSFEKNLSKFQEKIFIQTTALAPALQSRLN